MFLKNEFSNRLVQVSLFSAIVYYITAYPVVFESARKYFPIKFKKTHHLLIFHTFVFMVLMYVLTYFVFDPIVKVVEGSRGNKQSPGDIDEEVTEQQPPGDIDEEVTEQQSSGDIDEEVTEQQPPPEGQTISQDEWEQDDAYAQKVCPNRRQSCIDDTECSFYYGNPNLDPEKMNSKPKNLYDDLIQCVKETEVKTLNGVLSKTSGNCEDGQLEIDDVDNTKVRCITKDNNVIQIYDVYTCSEGWAAATYTCENPWEKIETALDQE